ncbi:hypothetical protein C8J57DRAFT_577255 [Mycena rebaudengoi]|nr:hypothetical protein C8J57DRAFT_577255 [Mycena rebaudengoi]
MSAFLGYLGAAFQRGAGIRARMKTKTVPLYHRQPSAWMQLVPTIIALDVVIIGNAVHATWTKWTYPPTTLPDGTEAPPSLRSPGLRGAICGMQIFTGFLVASSLMLFRSRNTTVLCLLPPKTPKAANRIFLQTTNNWRANGTIYSMSACTLTRVEESKLFLQVDGVFGGWQLLVDKKTEINGEPAVSIEAVCKDMLVNWRKAGGRGTINVATS